MQNNYKIKHLYDAEGNANSNLLNKPIVIWGCGNDGKKIYNKLLKMDANIIFFCDSNKELVGKRINNILVISYEELLTLKDINLVLAFHRWPEMCWDKLENNTTIFADFLYLNKSNHKCLICNNDNCFQDNAHFSPFLSERMFINKPPETKLVFCKDCDFYFSLYRPNEDEMSRLYTDYRDDNYQKQRQKYEKNYTKEFNEKLFNSRAEVELRKFELERYLIKNIDLSNIKTVLDYGGDKGQFVPDVFGNNCRKCVFDISGNETVKNVELISNLENLHNIKWDFIMCCHLLEHVSYPMDVIEIITNVLSEDGYFYLELPYDDFFMAYSDVEISEHINFYRTKSIEKIANLYKLNIISILSDNMLIRVLMKKC